MALILSLETATTNCSVALYEDENLLTLKEDNNNQYSHAESLHIFIQEVLKTTGIESYQLDAIAVSKGPGSYTGLRIGVSAAKGLCYALGIPLIAVNTLRSLAHQVKAEDGLIIPMLDARRMEVYTATFDNTYKELQSTEAKILSESSFETELQSGKVHLIGNGVSKFQEVCSSSNALFYPDLLPSARELGILANQKYLQQDFEDVAYFEPYYLKDFVAG